MRLLTLLFLAGCASAPASLDADLEAIRLEHNVPALAAVVTRSHGVIAQGAAGVRRANGTARLTIDDAFHIGSVTKPFTATIAAMLVEERKLRWDATIGETFPEWDVRAEYAGVNLAELLSHEGGIHAIGEESEMDELRRSGVTGDDPGKFARHVLTLDPIAPRGQYAYSNAGFAIAALMIERATGTPYEEQLLARILRPLRMTTAGFGWPAEVWGHGAENVESDPRGPYQLPAAFRPSGDLHMSMPDLASFLRAHLRALRGERSLIARTTAAHMHTRRVKSGLGFGVQKVRDLEPVSVYSGSADTFLTMIAIAPRQDVAVAVSANAAHPGAEGAVKKVLVDLLTEHARQNFPPGVPVPKTR